MDPIEPLPDQVDTNSNINESSKQQVVSVKSIWDRFQQTIPLVPSPLDIIETAKSICKNGIEGQGPPVDPRVTDLTWGWETKGRSQIGDRNGAVFYRLNVDKRQVDNGFLLVCRGANTRSHFKVILFDLLAEILFEEVCIKPLKASFTEAAIYFTKFETYSLGTATAITSDLPSFFTVLDNFKPSKKTIFPGQYLLCIQCTNILGLPTNFTISVVPSNNTLSAVNEIEEIDEAIINFKSGVDEVKQEYIKTKAAYEQSLLKLKQQEEQLASLLETRDKSYSLFLDGSMKVFKPAQGAGDESVAAVQPANTNPLLQVAGSDINTNNSTSSASNNDQPPTITAATLAANAAKTATEAWGGLTRRFSLGISQVKPILFSSSGTVTSSVLNNEGDSDYNSSVGASDEGMDPVLEENIATSSSSSANHSSVEQSPLDSVVEEQSIVTSPAAQLVHSSSLLPSSATNTSPHSLEQAHNAVEDIDNEKVTSADS